MQPLMEIACTPEKADLVRNFFVESEIPIWRDDLKPLLDPEIESGNNTTLATKRHIKHLTRVLTDWWKEAHYVQNKDTADYYGRITERVVQSPKALYEWPKHIEGVIIDARGVVGLKENPKIAFEYENGFEHLPNYTQNKQMKARSYATGVSRPAAHAQKRHRSAEADDSTGAMEPSQQKSRLLSMEEKETPANADKRQS